MGAASDLLDSQRAFITTLQSAGSAAQANAQSAASLALVEAISPLTYTPPKNAESPKDPGDVKLDLSPPKLTIPTKDYSKPTLDNIPDIGAGLMAPNFTAIYTAPAPRNTPSALRSFGNVAPSINTSFSFPTAPGLPDVVAPTFLDRILPTKGDVSVERFNVVAPSILPTPDLNYTTKYKTNFRESSVNAIAMANNVVDDQLSKINPQYDTQMAAIESQLTKYLAGGTGLKEDVEDAIYSRARAKMDVEAKRVQDATFADAAARGFTLPSGAMYSAMNRARQDAANNNAKSATDIAIAQAEMEQKNLQFAVTTSSGLRQSMLDSTLTFMGAIVTLNGQALQFAKNMLDADIEVYNAEVKLFTLQLDQYKTEVSVYELKSRIAMNTIEIYKAEIQAYSALLNADRSKVDIYQALLSANTTAVNLYKTRVDAVVSQASLEKLKLEMHQLAVQTFSAEVQAKNAEWQGYQAQLEGDLGAVKVFSAQVDAFNGQISAYKARIDADTSKMQGVVAKNNALIQQFNAEVGAWEAELKGEVAELSGLQDEQRGFVTQYQGDLQAEIMKAKSSLEKFQVQSKINMDIAQGDLQAEIAKKDAAAKTFNATAAIHTAILDMYSGPAKAAASAMNSLASVNEDV